VGVHRRRNHSRIWPIATASAGLLAFGQQLLGSGGFAADRKATAFLYLARWIRNSPQDRPADWPIRLGSG
jgi:hypothetical protein